MKVVQVFKRFFLFEERLQKYELVKVTDIENDELFNQGDKITAEGGC